MVRIIFICFLLFSSLNLLGEELIGQEKIFFSFLDQNNDNKISLEEINQSIKLIFQLIDDNQDGNISELELIELKNIIELLS